ncbi:hypothetical protein N9902_03410 [Akkermansiaceae bacterium]|nr:hypothetical protein [Akkermansiaceae bacterium]MDB4817135.1 hypothetical protein [bacterium]MDB4301884.1 hypothetical protein [Akkermansiaceae bacterium]MDB4321338.1 hypothetical protein [Akkermansiaceae bacterium]MDB4334555.1 hypothetical protein [Akkermansiaceae bacterium]
MKALLLLLALVSVCYGRMGETYAKCVERYGEGNKKGDLAKFEKNGVTIIVVFTNPHYGGRVIGISYLAPEKIMTEAGAVSLLSRSNSRSFGWMLESKSSKKINYGFREKRFPNGKLLWGYAPWTAEYRKKSGFLVIGQTTKYKEIVKRLEKLNKLSEDEDLEGF